MTNSPVQALFLLGVLCTTAATQSAPSEGGARVQEALQAGDFAQAESLLRQALNQEQSWQTQLQLAEVLLQRSYRLDTSHDLGQHLARGLVQEGQELLRLAQEAGGDSTRLRITLARCEWSLGNTKVAAGILSRAADSALSRSQTQDLHELNAACLEFELFEEADRQIQEAQSRGLLGSGEAALLRLRVRARRGLADPALEAARAAAADPEVESFQIAFSVWDAFVGDTIDLEGLLHAFSGLLQVRPGDGVFHFYRGATRFHARDYDGSESDLSAAEASGLLPAQVLEYQGKVFVRQQREEQALTAFQRLQDDFGAVRPAILGMLDVAASLGRRREYDASLRLYEQVLQLDPANEWAHLGAPLCHRGQGAVQDAEAAYLRGLEALPGHAQLLNDLALLLWGAGHQDRARQWFTEAVAAGSLDSAENLGVIARTVDGDPVEAAEYFARVLLDDPQRVKSRFYRELTLWESGESLTVSR